MKSKLVRMARLRRRVHGSWKVTLLAAILGWVVFGYAGLVSDWAGFFVVFGVFLSRPLMEFWFSSQFVCPHCEMDVFLDVSGLESRGGKIEEDGLKCPGCRGDLCERGDVVFEILD